MIPLLAHLAKGNVSFCHGVSSVVRRPLTFHIWIFSSETNGPIWTKLWWNGPGMVPFQNFIRWPRPSTKMAATAELSLILVPMGNSLKSGTTWLVGTKVGLNGYFVSYFQNYIWWLYLQINMYRWLPPPVHLCRNGSGRFGAP